jgi:hypothetical protein
MARPLPRHVGPRQARRLRGTTGAGASPVRRRESPRRTARGTSVALLCQERGLRVAALAELFTIGRATVYRALQRASTRLAEAFPEIIGALYAYMPAGTCVDGVISRSPVTVRDV